MAYAGTIPPWSLTTSADQNNSVVDNHSSPGVYPHFASRSSFFLGGLQVAAGTVVVIVSIMSLATYGPLRAVADIFCGLLFISAGANGIAAGHSRTHSPIVGCMLLSIFSSVVSVCGFFVWIVEAGEAAGARRGSEYVDVAVAISAVLIIVFLVESVVSIWAAAICCNVACCGHGQVTPVYPNQPGQTVVTVTHTNQGQYPMQYVPNPPPYTQRGYPMQQPGQGAYPMGATPYGAGMMQYPCPAYTQEIPQNSGGSGPPNVAFPSSQGQPSVSPNFSAAGIVPVA